MIPAAFDYLAPASLDEAIDLLGRHGPDAKILSGGMSLIPAMKIRLAEPAILIDVNGIPDLEYLREADGQLHIGAMTRESAFEHSGLVRSGYPILFETAKVIADPLVRNRATIGGNLAHADPANDHPATMLAVGATIVARGPHGTRVIAADDFFTGFFTTALEDGEIITEIRVPTPSKRSGGTYLKFERKVGDYAIAAVAVNLEVDESGQCTSARIGLTNVSDVPMRAHNAEAALIGHTVTAKAIDAASREAASECDPKADLRGPVDYKRDLVRVLTGRAITKAVARAQGEAH